MTHLFLCIFIDSCPPQEPQAARGAETLSGLFPDITHFSGTIPACTVSVSKPQTQPLYSPWSLGLSLQTPALLCQLVSIGGARRRLGRWPEEEFAPCWPFLPVFPQQFLGGFLLLLFVCLFSFSFLHSEVPIMPSGTHCPVQRSESQLCSFFPPRAQVL